MRTQSYRSPWILLVYVVAISVVVLADADEDKHCHELSSASSCSEYSGCGWDKEQNECFDEEEEEIVHCYELMTKNRCEDFSGCKWENITNECFDIMPKWIREGQMVPLSSLKSMLKEMNSYNSVPPIPPDSHINDSLFVVLPNCLHPEEVEIILGLESQLGHDTEVHDRSSDLEFHHTVHRIEPLMKQQQSMLFRVLISTMIHVDKHLWNILERNQANAVFPEVELITYEANPKLAFSEHTDNGSFLTTVFMLSRENYFEGGSLVFDHNRTVHLKYGECVVFRGDSLLHQVTTVTKGTRKVLQIELHGSHASEGGYDDEDDE
jgi:hypothetical protein